jgi:general nucleoside transport system permease protein
MIRLEKRQERSATMALLSPVIAVALMLVTGGIIFALRGLDPISSLIVYFVEPLMSVWSLQELVVKAAPLVLIGAGLAIAYTANVWNIGAEGQLTMGAVAGAALPLMFPDWQSPLVLFLMLMCGIAGGMIWGAIPALLKNRFNANEILTSLMLVYVAQFILDYLVRGPWRDPMGFNFPKSMSFTGWYVLPTLEASRLHLGAIFAIVAAVALGLLMAKTLKGYEIRVLGQAPRAGQFAGFSRKRIVTFCFLLTGGLAGLAGICEVAGPIGHLQPSISPGYGFTAIIVAFLARLNPLGTLVSGVVLAISYLGGEAAQISLGVSDKIARVFQGILLFYILACDTLILYRIRRVGAAHGH